MRDHLLGCQAFLPPEPDPQDRTISLRRRYPMGLPLRAERELARAWEKELNAKQEITAFEAFDHTPAGMVADFPREYDLRTMLQEAAGRFKFFTCDFGKGPDFSAFMAVYDAEMQRLCGIK